MTASTSADRCYRHPDRQSWVLCSRCGRTICGQCQTQAPVGVRCPECIREERDEQRQTQRQTRIAHGGPRTELGRRARAYFAQPTPVTTTIGIVTILVGVLQLLMPGLAGALRWDLAYSLTEPWRFVTWALVHGSPLHLAFNMLVLFMVGPSIEQRIGKLPYLAAYVVSAIGAAVAIAWLQPGSAVVGASGAIYALFGMAIGMQRMLGRVQPALLLVVGINLAITFLFGGISWSAHVGGLAVGLALGFGIGLVDRRMRSGAGVWIVIAAVAAVCAAAFALRVLSLLG